MAALVKNAFPKWFPCGAPIQRTSIHRACCLSNPYNVDPSPLYFGRRPIHHTTVNHFRSSKRRYSGFKHEEMCPQPWESNPLLPKDVVPSRYDIYLDPHIDEGDFSGRVAISLEVTAPKDYIVLHIKGLNITSTQLLDHKNASLPVKCSFEYEPHEFWVVVMEEELNPGKYILSLEFNGSLLGTLVGFYRSSYKKEDGTVSHIATTKFEPTYARRAFPCFDEPSFKATFSTKLVRPAEGDYIALSNMNQIGEEKDSPEAGKVTVEFAETPRMSTYLACFIVCNFPHLPPVVVKNSGTPVKIYARAEQLPNAKHALDVAVEVLGHFNEYFKMKYPLPKLDLIAVPDFVSGAMENWGLITFRESHMLASPHASAHDLLTTANTVSHELAHMWFGDIVTMGWWDDLWLNEGFATFLANAVQAKTMPTFPVQGFFASHYLQQVMADDAAVSSHPIIRHVANPDQITEAFDAISYKKGASVLRMIEDFDKEGFRRAVVRYLEAFKYSNANTSDLWDKLDDEYTAVKTVSRMLDTWTKQMGFPMVLAERKGRTVELKQIRFTNPSNATYDKSSSMFEYKWDIPVKYITSNNKKSPKSLVMKMEDEIVGLRLSEGSEWFKLNADSVGFYRVNYEEAEWERLKRVLEDHPNDMSPIDRANLIDDAFNLALAGYINYKIPLHLIQYFQRGLEREWEPWHVLSVYFSRLRDLLHNSKQASNDLRTYFQRLVGPTLDDSFWHVADDEPPSVRFVKGTLINLCCKVGIESCLNEANKIYKAYLESGIKPPIDVRTTVLIYGIQGPKLKENWNGLWKQYLAETDPLDKEILITALCSVKDPELIHKLLELAKNEKYVRSQDYFRFLFDLSKSPEGNGIVWDWFRANYDYLVDRFTLNHRSFGRALPAFSRQFYTEERLKELTDFIAAHPEAGASTAGRKKAVEETKANILLYNEFQPVIKNVLRELVA